MSDLANFELLSMTNIAILALANFVFAASITPGPNNLMLATSGLNFGLTRTIPHMLGVVLGFLLMVFLACLGLGKVFQIIPILQTILTYLGGAYMLYLAYRIATASGISNGAAKSKPLSFTEAALFQWINPKAWMMAVTFSSAFGLSTDNLAQDTLVTILVVLCVGGPCPIIWSSFGAGLRRWLTNPTYLRYFNITMASFMILTVALLVFGQ